MSAKKALIIFGILVILLTAGFFSYKTLLNYQGLINQNQPLAQDSQTSSLQQDQGLKEEKTPNLNLGNDSGQRVLMPKALEGKSAVIIISFKNFQDEEYFSMRQILQAAGAKIFTASVKPGTARGENGGEASVNLLVKDINAADYDTVVFIGGPGALPDLDNEESYKVAKDTISQRKLLSAISISPIILAKAGILNGKKATVWSSEMDKSAVKILKDNGAIYQENQVVRDGIIITGNGQNSSEKFAIEIVDLLSQ